MKNKMIDVRYDKDGNSGKVIAKVDNPTERQTEKSIIEEACDSLSKTMDENSYAEWDGESIITKTSPKGEIQELEFGFKKVKQ